MDGMTGQLNDAQMRAAQHHTGPMLVLAGPGSGKTTVILHRVRHLTAVHGVNPRSILVVTFTKAAADEMRTRYEALPDAACGVTFCTLHAFFFHVLRDAGICGLDSVADGAKRRAILVRALEECDARFIINYDALERLANGISRVRGGGADFADAQVKGMSTDTFRHVYNAYHGILKEEKLIDFDGMQAECHALFARDAQAVNRWRARYPYILVDEFQDVNRMQYECLQTLAAPANNIFAVGDDDQSIYGFRGCAPAFMLGFPKDFPGAEAVALQVNYRSSSPVTALANAVIQANLTRGGKRMVSAGAEGGSPVVAYPPNPQAEADWVAEKILSLQKSCAYEEIAVIFRMHIQAQPLMEALKRQNIPFTAQETLPNPYAHWIAEDLTAYVRLALDRGADAALERIVNRPMRYLPNAAIAQAMGTPGGALDALYQSPLLDRRRLALLDSLLLGLGAVARRKPYDALRYIREGIGYDDYLIAYAARRKTDVQAFLDVADSLTEAARGYDSLADWLAYADTAASPEVKPLAEASKKGVTLTTMHSAKGLEFDAVFVVGVTEGIVPHRDSSSTPAAVEEERRLLYVALTRARRWLFLSACREVNQKPVKPSRFLAPFIKGK